jgi:lysophospholipase L1-like esterase
MLRALAIAAMTVGLCLISGAAATKKPAAKKSATKKPVARKAATKTSKTSKKRPVRRASVPRPPVVSQKVRLQSVSFVNETMDAAAAAAIENSAALVPFYERLHQMESQGSAKSIHILQYGDSHSASDDWANQLRLQFQTRFGNGGAGFTLAGTPFPGYRRRDVKGGQSRAWQSEGLLTKGADGMYGLGGAAIVAARGGETVYLDAEGEKVELHFLRQPGGGSFRILVDGTEVAVLDTNGPVEPGYWSAKYSEGLRRYAVETLDANPVKLFGWVTERERGLTWETLGINGAQATLSLRWDGEQLRSHLARRDPALLVLAYGTNEAGGRDWNSENYRQAFRQVVARFRELAPEASILIVGPPDRAARVRRTWIGMPKLDMIAEAQRDVAKELGCAFWDLRERMGGDGAMKRWVYAGMAQGDFVHLTVDGYRLVGETLYRDLIAHYEEFRRARQRVFGDVANEAYGPAR